MASVAALPAQHDHDHEDESDPHDQHAGHAEHDEHDEHDDHDGHDEHEEGPLQIAPEVLEEFGIVVRAVGPGALHEEVVLPGEIQFNREQLAYATPRFEGTVQEIRVRLADHVERGQVLATLESTETLRPFEITAPFAGTIVNYAISPGQTVEAGEPVFTVADLSTVWADLRIYQRNLHQIHEGQPVIVRGTHQQGEFRGKIAYIAPTVDEHTRTGLARVIVENLSENWKPGQFVKGAVSIEEHPIDVLVPRSAVLTMEGKSVVFVETEEGFEPRPVHLGHSDSESFQVVRGLEPGDRIVVENALSLKAEMGKGSFGGHHH